MGMNWRRLLRRPAAADQAAAEAGLTGTAPAFAEQVQRARLEWQLARQYFENVTDPDLVDHAIAVLHAAEKKYMVLVRVARDQNLSLPAPGA